jgi:hypothetical protein
MKTSAGTCKGIEAAIVDPIAQCKEDVIAQEGKRHCGGHCEDEGEKRGVRIKRVDVELSKVSWLGGKRLIRCGPWLQLWRKKSQETIRKSKQEAEGWHRNMVHFDFNSMPDRKECACP